MAEQEFLKVQPREILHGYVIKDLSLDYGSEYVFNSRNYCVALRIGYEKHKIQHFFINEVDPHNKEIVLNKYSVVISPLGVQLLDITFDHYQVRPLKTIGLVFDSNKYSLFFSDLVMIGSYLKERYRVIHISDRLFLFDVVEEKMIEIDLNSDDSETKLLFLGIVKAEAEIDHLEKRH